VASLPWEASADVVGSGWWAGGWDEVETAGSYTAEASWEESVVGGPGILGFQRELGGQA